MERGLWGLLIPSKSPSFFVYTLALDCCRGIILAVRGVEMLRFGQYDNRPNVPHKERGHACAFQGEIVRSFRRDEGWVFETDAKHAQRRFPEAEKRRSQT
jgi:hypothetical protein